MKPRPPVRRSPSADAAAFDASPLGGLIAETTALFHRLRAVAEAIHGEGAPSAGLRGVLRELALKGPRTVPEMARARPVSRQHVQVLVDTLLAEGLVETVENPAHRRSHLVRVTPAGERRVAEMTKREATLVGGLRHGVSAVRLTDAAKTLRAVREAFQRAPALRPHE